MPEEEDPPSILINRRLRRIGKIATLNIMGVTLSGSASINREKYMILADGENLVLRYQALLQNRKAVPAVVHIPDVFVWHLNLASIPGWSAIRVNYYTSAVGDDDKIREIEKQISNVLFSNVGESPSQICPRVFKKLNKSRKTKIVDISFATLPSDTAIMGTSKRYCFFPGMGDYLPLVKEIMRNGTQVWLGAFSDGLDDRLPSAVDRFINLDSYFFSPRFTEVKSHSLFQRRQAGMMRLVEWVTGMGN